MKPPPFDYMAATSVDDALAALSGDRDARILAGGQSLLPILNLRLGAPELLIDIARVEGLDAIDVSNSGVKIGANVTQSQALGHAELGERWPLLTEALGNIGHTQIRNRGTVCGSLAHNDPQSELPTVAVALDASMVIQSASGSRTVSATEMFTGSFSTALEPDEMLVAVEFPNQPAAWAFQEFAVRPGDFALGGVASVFDPAASVARVVMFGAGGCPMRATAVEEVLVAGEGDLNAAATASVEALDPTGDIHASAPSRRTLLTKLLIDTTRQTQERARTETEQ